MIQIRPVYRIATALLQLRRFHTQQAQVTLDEAILEACGVGDAPHPALIKARDFLEASQTREATAILQEAWDKDKAAI